MFLRFAQNERPQNTDFASPRNANGVTPRWYRQIIVVRGFQACVRIDNDQPTERRHKLAGVEHCERACHSLIKGSGVARDIAVFVEVITSPTCSINSLSGYRITEPVQVLQTFRDFMKRHRYWLAVWLPLAAWFAYPLWSAHVVPLHDLPNHLARITALHYLGDPRWNLSPYYARSLHLVPYLAHFYVVHLLTYVTRSVITANLVFMTAYIVATPLCGFAFARATGRSPWLSLFLLPLSISFYFQWGFIAFCAGVMLMLPAMAALYRLFDAPTLYGAIAVGLWTAVLYLFQIVPWAAFGLYAIVLLTIELAHRRWRGPLFAAAAMAPSLLMFAVGVMQARQFNYFSQPVLGSSYEAVTDTPAKLVGRAANMINWFQSETADEWIAVGVILALLLLVVSDGGARIGTSVDEEPWRRRVRIPVAFVVFLVMAFATPFWVKRPFNWWMINQRFLLPAACVAVFFPRGPIRGARALLFGGAIILMAALPSYMVRQYRDFSRRAWPLIELIRMTPLGSNTLVLHEPGRSFEDPALAPQMSIWRELYNYPLVYRGGFDPYMYDDGFPIRRIATLPSPKVPRAAEKLLSPDEARFNPTTMMRGWDYFIVSNDARDVMPPDGAVLVREAGSWSLYRNIAKDTPPTTPPATDD